MMRVGCGAHMVHGGHAAPSTHIDPVCEREVAAFCVNHKGRKLKSRAEEADDLFMSRRPEDQVKRLFKGSVPKPPIAFKRV